MKKMARGDIVTLIKAVQAQDLPNKEHLEKLKRVFQKKSNVSGTVSNSTIIETYKELVNKGEIEEDMTFEQLLRIKKIRTSSGVAPIAILTKPYPCPGKCSFCPSQWQMPKSYLSNEPAVMRAINNKFDPYLQVTNRLNQYKNIGHTTDKIELIILGGTFSAYPKTYREEFVKRCFEAANGKTAEGLEEAQLINEKAEHRIVTLCIETRPDTVTEKEIKFLRKLGTTRVQIGVQTVYDDILAHTKRGHDSKETIRATKLLKDAGFKICYHMMPNLPLSNPELDLEAFKSIFFNPAYIPDTLKIYPCVVLKESDLYKEWFQGKYKMYTDEALANLVLEIKKIIPEHVRIDRVYRDIPKQSIIAGSTTSNLRQVLKKRMNNLNLECKCIRCREIKMSEYQEEVYQKVQEYEASDGKEYFLSFVDRNNKLYAILRLRIPSQIFNGEKHFIDVLQDATIIREIHTYGSTLGVGKIPNKETQHRGLGKELLRTAEKISRNLGIKKITVIAGVGVRNYFRKFGYESAGTYMVKSL